MKTRGESRALSGVPQDLAEGSKPVILFARNWNSWPINFLIAPN
jgi:hypothetical protein